jgi:hypothetical protein
MCPSAGSTTDLVAKYKKRGDMSPEELEAVRKHHRDYMREYYKRMPAEVREKWIKRAASYASRNPKYRRDEHYRRKYGITLSDYNRMRAEQNYCCALCFKHEDEVWLSRPFGKEIRYGKLAVDHCHETGVVRGLLCAACNNLLGQVTDDVDRLCRMAEYVARHRRILKVVS